VRSLLELVDSALPGGVPPGRVKLLQQAGLLDACRSGVATPSGFVDACSLAIRALVATDAELEAAGGGVAGCKALANPAGVRAGLSGGAEVTARAQTALGAACRASLDQKPTTAAEDTAALRALSEGSGSSASSGGLGATGTALTTACFSADMPMSRQRLALEYRLAKKQVLSRCASSCDANAAMAV